MTHVAAEALDSLIQSTCSDPHSLLGLHDERTVRLWRPGALTCHLEVEGETVEAKRVHEAGLFEYTHHRPLAPDRYRVYHTNGMLAHDPYAFPPTFGNLDEYLWNEGTHVRAYERLGAREIEHRGARGTLFAVWAPAARGVSLVSDFNNWDGRVTPMRQMGVSGVWELFVPDAGEGLRYKFEIQGWDGRLRVKADPFAYWSEVRPYNASIVFDLDCYEWGDQRWMENRRTQTLNRPMSIYEVHLGSWRKSHGEFLNYRELARELSAYCLEMGFTHVELLPITEHPLDESWGYQVSGYYSATSRFGTPEDFQFFVDTLHQKGIGVILDWVPAHFPQDDFSLAQFDGTHLYEHADPRQGYHPHWNTAIFNYGRHEVSNFLIANALFWFDKMHIDGLRVDAVASMLYLDYGRREGEWIPNAYGGKENLEAIAFLQTLNTTVHDHFRGVLMIAEESTAFPNITRPVSEGGLGFDLKWNMGWMNDLLHYLSRHPYDRHWYHNNLTHILDYAFFEQSLLPLSHDEVVHQKRSLLGKMPEEAFTNLRLLLSTQWCMPGKKLLFMGSELGLWTEWNCKEELPWGQLQYEPHKQTQQLVRRLNQLYRDHPALWERDFDWLSLEWVLSDYGLSTIAYKRHAENEVLLCLHNFSPHSLPEFILPVGPCNEVVEIFDSNGVDFQGEHPITPVEGGFKTSLTPLSTRIFELR
ncbi:MAG: 1,4-alpha-glucan branching protein GlgB [Parachlamydiales bacterium]